MVRICQEDSDKYFSIPDPPSNKKIEEALKYAVESRKFEIELYWKRANYFWLLLVSVFAGFFAVSRGTIEHHQFYSFVLCCIGVVFSFAWVLANKGSKQWQENWENHVDLLEDSVIGPLFKINIRRPDGKKKLMDPCGISVSKINLFVSMFTFGVWLFLAAFSFLSAFDISEILLNLPMIDIRVLAYVLIAVTIVVVLILMVSCCHTDGPNYDGLNAIKRDVSIKKP